MTRLTQFTLAGIVSISALAFTLCRTAQAADDGKKASEAVAEVHGAGADKDKITGKVAFIATTDGVKVVADIEGLSPGEHGFHIHQVADLSDPELKGAGGHWNPDKHKHGGPDSAEHHAGDMGNLTADDKGHAHLELELKGITIEGDHGVVGHSVIIHAKADDLKSQPAGDSGKRIAGGVIKAAEGK